MLLGQVLVSAALFGGVAVALARGSSSRGAQACGNPLVIDDFTKWNTSLNTLSGATSDDGTMNSTELSGDILTFTPNTTATSYLYEQFNCTKATTLGLDTLAFNIKGPKAASVSLELQTQTSCITNSSNYNSYYFTVNGLSGNLQTVTVPLSSWTGANLDSLVGVLFYGFSKGMTGTDNVWQLESVSLVCSVGAAPPPVPPTSATPTTATPTTAPGGLTTTVIVTATVTVVPTVTTPVVTTTPGNPWTIPGWGWPRPTTTTIPWWGIGDPWGPGDGDGDNAVVKREAAIPAATPAPDATPASTPSTDAACSGLLIDDWTSQSRLTFLFYNALLQAASDDGSMKSMVVRNNMVTLTPTGTDSYFYTQLGCINANEYGGVSLRIKAPAGSDFDVQLASTKNACGTDDMTSQTLSTKKLGWTFDGTEKLYTIPLSSYTGIDLSKFDMVYLTNLKSPVTLGPMEMYCGSNVTEYVAPQVIEPAEPTATVAAPPSKATNLIIDQFKKADSNSLGQWHGADDGVNTTFKSNTMKLWTNDSDLQWTTTFSDTCRDMTPFLDSYLHIAYSGSNKFSIAVQQHNQACNNTAQPYPETWDSVEASRYGSSSDIYVPLEHFNVNLTRAIGITLKGFYTLNPTEFSIIEIVNKVPDGWQVPEKLPSGNFVFACKRPNSFAFAIDDGEPKYAQEVMNIIKEENITVTFFTLGAALQDPTTNLSAVYNEMAALGHQIAMHSYTHPPMEGLPDEAAIDWEYNNMIQTVAKTFNGLHTPYFRLPFGTEGARTRQRLAAVIDNPYIVQWSVDVEDWMWALTDTPEKQLDAFKRDVSRGGDLVVMHYLYPTTVSYLRQFIQIAKATGKRLMRVDQCMMDPNAPPLT